MCSHYTCNQVAARIKLRDRLEVFPFMPRASIRPTDLAPVILPDADSFSCRDLAWGWRVPWAKSPLINAKSETLTSLPTFKPHLEKRCLILLDGFYEKGVRFIQSGGPLFALAGLWQSSPDGDQFTMLTTAPNATVSPFHQRMPFILSPAQYTAWLGTSWRDVLAHPDQSPLEKIQNQPDLF